MKKIFIGVALLLSNAIAFAQDKSVNKLKDESGKEIAKDAADTIVKTWKKGGVVGANLAQASLSNWAAGGDDFSLSANALVSLFAFHKKGRTSWDNTFEFNFGYIKTTSLGGRKNDDRIDLLSKYGWALSPKWDLSGIFNFRSQLFKGYNYSAGAKELSSAFLSPAYLLLGVGLNFKPTSHFSVFISPATVRLTVVKDDSLSAKGLYGVEPGEHHKWEFGAFLSANYVKDLNKIVSYKGRLDLFSNYAHNPQNVDFLMSNIFAAKLSKWVTATWNFDMIYDDDVRLFGANKNAAALQVKSLIGVGLLVKFSK
jgi:hypothetical protein